MRHQKSNFEDENKINSIWPNLVSIHFNSFDVFMSE